MRAKKMLSQILAVGLILAVTACGSPAPQGDSGSTAVSGAEAAESQKKEENQKLTLAVSVPLTGKMAQYGISYKNAIELAVGDFNAKGGLNGQEVKAEFFDDAGDQSAAINVANLIIENEDVFAFIGSYGSSTSLVMAPIFQEEQIPMISPNTSHPDFFQVGDMMMPLSAKSDICFAEVAQVLTKDYSPSRVAMIYQNNDSGVTIDETFKKEFAALGVEYLSETFAGGETSDFTPIVSSLYQSKPDMLVVCADYNYGSEIIIQTRQLGIEDLQMVGIASMFKPQVLDLTGEYGEGLVLCGVQRIYTEDVIASNDYGSYCEDVIARYTKAHPDTAFDAPAALAYDAAMLACQAAATTGTSDPLALVEQMKKLDTELCSGDAWFDENGEFYRSVYSYQIKDGKFTLLAD